MKGWHDRNAASDQYWKNDQGEYIKSDDKFYNPNRDPSVNNQDWAEMEEQREAGKRAAGSTSLQYVSTGLDDLLPGWSVLPMNVGGGP